MRTTQLRLVAALVVLGGALGWTSVALFERWGTGTPWVPWLAAAGLTFYAGLVGTAAWYMYDRVHRRRLRFVGPFAVRMLVLGKASVLAGSLVTGGYAGYALRFVGESETSGGHDRMVHGFVAAAAGVLVVVAGMLCERACRVPEDRDRPGPVGADGPARR